MIITDADIVQWYDCYVRTTYVDPHQEFANRRGTSRQEAKVVALQIAYSIKNALIMKG